MMIVININLIKIIISFTTTLYSDELSVQSIKTTGDVTIKVFLLYRKLQIQDYKIL